MSTFDANAYRKRVLAPLTERAAQDLPDPFQLVDLDPTTDDDALIRERIGEVLAFWQRERNSPKYKGLVITLLAQKAQMTEALVDAGRRAELRRRVLAERTVADAARFTKLDAMVSSLMEKNRGIPRSKLESLRTVAGRSGVTDEEFRSRIASRPIVEDVVAANAPLAAPVRRQIRVLLDEFGRLSGGRSHRTLFQFLGLAAGAPVTELAGRRDSLAARNRQRRHDRERTVVDELLAFCTAHLIEGDPGAYVAGLAEDVKERLRDDVETAIVVDDRVTAPEFERLVREAVAEGLSPPVARLTLVALAQECGGGVDMGTPVEYVVCPSCSTAEAAGGARRCRRCGTALYATCPVCHTEVEAALAGCPKCGTDLAAVREAEADARLAQAALEAGALVEAKWRIERALAQADALPRVRELAATIEARYNAAASQWRSAGQALSAGRFYDASQLLQQLSRAGSDVPGAEGGDLEAAVTESEAGMAAAAREVARVSGLDGIEREQGVLDLLQRLPDCPPAMALLREIPVSAPRRVNAMVNAGGVKVVWRASGAPGRVEYRVERSEHRAGDGERGGTRSLGVTDQCEMEDAGVPAGAIVTYAVTARRYGISSGVTRTSPLLVAREVEALGATEHDGAVVLRWRSPAPGASVFIERGSDPGGSEPIRRHRAEGTTWRDESVVNGREYRYRVFVEYPDGRGGSFRTAGREVSARPTAPPGPLEHLVIWTDAGEVRITWEEPAAGAVEVYRAGSPPDQPLGSLLDARSLGRLGSRVPPAGPGLAVDRLTPTISYYVPVTVIGSMAALGPVACHVGVADISQLRAHPDGDDVVLQWRWPQGCTEALVLWRRDRPPTGPDDDALRAKVTNTKYEIGGGWRLVPEGRDPYHVAVVPGVRQGRDLQWAPMPGPGATLVVPGRPPRLAYRIETRGRRRRSFRVWLVPGEPAPDALPELVVVARAGEQPPSSVDDGVVVARVPPSVGPVADGSVIDCHLGEVALPVTVGLFVADAGRAGGLRLVDPPAPGRVMR